LFDNIYSPFLVGYLRFENYFISHTEFIGKISLSEHLTRETNFSEFLLVLVGLIFLTHLWVIYYLHANIFTLPQDAPNDVRTLNQAWHSLSSITIVNSLLIVCLVLINFVYIQKFSTQFLFYSTMYISNPNFHYLFCVIVLLFIVTSAATQLYQQNVTFNAEYLMFIYLVLISSWVLVSSTSLFAAIFVLEFIAVLIFAKFAVGRVIYPTDNLVVTNPLARIVQFSYGLFNSLYLQFWANFISSILLFYSLLGFHYMFGTSEFFWINYFYIFLSMSQKVSGTLSEFISTTLVLGFLIKLGLAPYQFFKIETYKGLPIFVVITYTVVYLVVYVYFFVYLLCMQIPSIHIFIWDYLLYSLLVSIFYIIYLLFDTKNFRAFLSYSTIVTLSNLLIIVTLL